MPRGDCRCVDVPTPVGHQRSRDARATRTSVEIIPGIEVNWSAAVDIVAAVAKGGPEVQTIVRVDVPTAVQSAFSITVGGARELGALTGKTAEEWLTILTTGAARQAEGL